MLAQYRKSHRETVGHSCLWYPGAHRQAEAPMLPLAKPVVVFSGSAVQMVSTGYYYGILQRRTKRQYRVPSRLKYQAAPYQRASTRTWLLFVRVLGRYAEEHTVAGSAGPVSPGRA
eukprot:560608-Rhodomonas_salina.14